MKKGLIHIYYGDGKGKSAAAIGQGVCAASQGSTVCFASFLKGASNQADALKGLRGFFLAAALSKPFYLVEESQKAEYASLTLKLFHQILIEAAKKDYDMLILDDVLTAVELGIIYEADLLTFLSFKPQKLDVILTGNSITPRLADCADNISYITNNLKY